MLNSILGDPGAVSRVDKMFVVKVYCKIETSDLTVNSCQFSLKALESKNFSVQSWKQEPIIGS